MSSPRSQYVHATSPRGGRSAGISDHLPAPRMTRLDHLPGPGETPRHIKRHRRKGEETILKFEGLTDRERAEILNQPLHRIQNRRAAAEGRRRGMTWKHTFRSYAKMLLDWDQRHDLRAQGHDRDIHRLELVGVLPRDAELRCWPYWNTEVPEETYA